MIAHTSVSRATLTRSTGRRGNMKERQRIQGAWLGTMRVLRLIFGVLMTALTVIAVFASNFLRAQGENSVTSKIKRDSSWLTDVERQSVDAHPFTLNFWYRYAKYIAHNNTNCYICSRMPLAVLSPSVVPQPVAEVKSHFPAILKSAESELTVTRINDTLIRLTGAGVQPPVFTNATGNHLGLNDSLVAAPMIGPVWIPEGVRFECFTNGASPEGERQDLGKVSAYHCASVYAPCTTYGNTSELNITQAPEGATCVPYFEAPDFTGTLSQSDIYWLCGFYLYTNLPPRWFGRCALVRATQHSYMVSAQGVRNGTIRVRRLASDPHDPVCGSDVPQEEKQS